MQKFYQSVAVVQGEGGYAVQLDGKPVRTPAKQPLVIASEKLAEHVAEEWRVQGERINPDAMPITRILTIARDRVPHDRALLIDDVVRYAGTDLLCYRAGVIASDSDSKRSEERRSQPIQPKRATSAADAARWIASTQGSRNDASLELSALQDLHFTPILDWAAGQGITLHVTESLTPIPQPESSLARVREMVAAADDTELAALALITPLFGSAVLALALWQGAIDAETALHAARLDETHQSARWGEDAEAAAVWAARARDIRAGAIVLASNRK